MKDKKLRDFYQNKNRERLMSGYPRQDMLFKKIKKYIPKGSDILEIGFGDGYLLNKLMKGNYNAIGQDLSEINIEITKKKVDKKITFLLGDDSGSLKVSDNSIDGFIASEVLEHMDNSALKMTVQEIKRILKKGGFAFITFPARENMKLNECICPNCEEVFHKWGHKQYWDRKKIISIFEGLEIIEIKEFFGRYVGANLIEKVLGYVMFFIRTLIDKISALEGKTFLVILKK